MSIDAITDAIHDYMYEKLNESPETEEEKKMRHVDKRKMKNNEEQAERYAKDQTTGLQQIWITQLVQTA